MEEGAYTLVDYYSYGKTLKNIMGLKQCRIKVRSESFPKPQLMSRTQVGIELVEGYCHSGSISTAIHLACEKGLFVCFFYKA